MDDLGGDEAGSGGEGAPAWMATFGDLMSLLLTFFVLLLSFANMDIQKFHAMAGSMQDAFGVESQFEGTYQALSTSPVELSTMPSSSTVSVLDDPALERAAEEAAEDEAMLERIEQTIRDEQLGEIMQAVPSDRGIRIQVQGRMLFDPASATLRPESFAFLDEIAALTSDSPYNLSIEGHTDDVPISTPDFPSNWDLSAARSIAALRYLVDVAKVDTPRISVAAFAGTRPMRDNGSEESRAANRRVEFVFQR